MRKLKNIFNTKNKKIIAIVSCIAFITIGSIAVYAFTNKEEKELLEVVKEIILEYGDEIPEDTKNYINISQLTEEETKDVLKNTKILIPDIKFEEEKVYPTIGEYTVIVMYQEEKKETTLIVEDTTAPVFNDVNEISIEQGTEDFPFHEHIEATDLQEITYEFHLDTVDVNTPGEYTMLVTATDASNNVAEKEIKVIVEPKEEEIEIEPISNNTQANYDTSNSASTHTPPPPPVPQTRVDLNVPYINQYSSGAPMGCEAASLLQALHYKRYATNHNLSSFLREMPIAPDGNPYNGFSNTPYEVLPYYDYYQSIFASPLAQWGSRYGNVANISGANVETLKNELRNGNPIVIYVTYNFQNAIWQDWWFGRAINNMHVMTLSGFDDMTGQYKVTDPAKGTYWVSRATFERSYNNLQWAVVVR